MTAFQYHKRRWERCTKCALCTGRKHVVFFRGSLPAEVLFVGEAPGKAENLQGLPFWGPAGKELDRLINRAGYDLCDHDVLPVRRCFTNLVGCIPKDEEGDKLAEPPVDSIMACAPKLRELAELCQPKLIVCVGKWSEKWTRKILEGGNDRGSGTRTKTNLVKSTTGNSKVNGVMGRGTDAIVLPVGHRYISITHPAAILRADVSQKALARQRVVVTLADALDALREKEQHYDGLSVR